MRFHLLKFTFFLMLTALVAGCARTGAMTARAPGLDKPGIAESAKTSKSASDDKSTDAAASKPDDAKPASDTAETPETATTPVADESTPADDSATPPAQDASETPATEQPPAPPDGLDAETLMLMNEHLKQVPFAERERLYQEWKALDAQTIREKIQAREAGATTDSSSTNPVQPPVDSNTPAEAGISPPDVDSAVADSNATPVAFESAEENPFAEDTADEERERPVPLMNGLISDGAEAPPEERTSADQTDWDAQLHKLIPIAEARAETTHALYLESQSKSTSDEAATDDALRRDYIASQVDLRLLYLMAGECARALQIIPDLEPAEQEFWRQLLWGMASYFDVESLPDRTERVTQTIEQLRAAINKLQGKAKLQLQNVAFCRKITSFGNFERFEEDKYTPGQKVLLYAEIINFKSIQGEMDGLYKTQLKSTIEILRDGESDPLQRIEFEPTVDLCRSHRQDYFHSYELKLPANLPTGAHVLKLTVEDTQSQDLAVYTLNFTVE